MALRHAILAALSRGVPRTGYELNTSFNDDADRAWHASPSQVYSELTKLEGKGLIEISERTERGRTSYAITEAGLAELRRWLIHDEPDHSIRDDAMLRLVTLWVLDDTTAGYLIDAEVSHQRKRQLSLSHLLETWDGVREDTRVWRNRRALYSLWLAQTELTLAWLDGLRDVLGTDEPVPDLLERHWPAHVPTDKV
ncbi:PadR family transcriptional regulator [Rathayibacter sp. VKM Ac-2927]|uniref:PadR family transcriptional regulator n=1 Tax=Rathayibacter sp. VKM Ac-2927 TaxID=2929478 RepID=UPI001FB40275|nr:PadR family transcriptional regulator [Rathayibacter sp. VKM Ac-2927]MCJ1687163.1 PadR family transcriptional regulator [Rathayibacter sp. VKM Ac-2927]